MATRRGEKEAAGVGESAVEILGIGMVTPVGLSARQTAASVRTGIGRLGESYVTDRYGEMLVMGLVDAGELPALCEELADPDGPDQELSPRQERLARLAGPALLEAIGSHAPASLPLLLALPEAHPETRHAVGAEMIGILATQTERRFDPELSRTYALGRAGGFAALDDALDLLAAGDEHATGAQRRRWCWLAPPTAISIWGCSMRWMPRGGSGPARSPTDSCPAKGRRSCCSGRPARRAQRPAADRAHHRRRSRARGGPHVQQPSRTAATGWRRRSHALFERAGSEPSRKIACVYAGLNGESFWAKEWGVAQIRCAGRLRDRLRVQHPADCFGDAGAALGPIMLGLGRAGSVARAHRRRLSGVGRRRPRRARRGAAHGVTDVERSQRKRSGVGCRPRRVISLRQVMSVSAHGGTPVEAGPDRSAGRGARGGSGCGSS